MRAGNRKSLAPFYLTVVLVLAGLFVAADMRLKSSVLTLAQAKAQLYVVALINEVVEREIAAQTDYQDIFAIHKDHEGNIVMIQSQTHYISSVVTRTSAEIAQQLQGLEETIDVPLGQLTGSQLLAAYGPKFKVKIIPAGQVSVEVHNTFEEAGINQTRHIVHFLVKTKIVIAVPYRSEEVEAVAEVPLAEMIIVGKVPNTYMKLDDTMKSAAPYFLPQIP
jgi:sporulation protein YunB